MLSSLNEGALDAEEKRRRYCVTKLRHNDMGEAVTNRLMEQISENPDILRIKEEDSDQETFEIKEFNQRGTVILQTRIGSIEMSDSMAIRLRSLYVTQNPILMLTPEELSGFSRAAFLLLYRYSYVDPGFRRQGYLAPKYFEDISRAFGRKIDLEGFASAFNTTIPRYCSLFPDIEAHFGSLGSFFDLDYSRDLHLIQVSPPRIGSITSQAIRHSIKLLEEAEGDLSIITLTPFAWTDVSKLIEDSGFEVWHNIVKPGDKIDYHDVVRNTATRYPMPRVTVLSKQELSPETSRLLHESFSSSR